MKTQIQILLEEYGFRYDPSAFATLQRVFSEANVDEMDWFVKRANSMPYQQYLRTIYWGVIRGIMIHTNPRCRVRLQLLVILAHLAHALEDDSGVPDQTG